MVFFLRDDHVKKKFSKHQKQRKEVLRTGGSNVCSVFHRYQWTLPKALKPYYNYFDISISVPFPKLLLQTHLLCSYNMWISLELEAPELKVSDSKSVTSVHEMEILISCKQVFMSTYVYACRNPRDFFLSAFFLNSTNIFSSFNVVVT